MLPASGGKTVCLVNLGSYIELIRKTITKQNKILPSLRSGRNTVAALARFGCVLSFYSFSLTLFFLLPLFLRCRRLPPLLRCLNIRWLLLRRLLSFLQRRRLFYRPRWWYRSRRLAAYNVLKDRSYISGVVAEITKCSAVCWKPEVDATIPPTVSQPWMRMQDTHPRGESLSAF